MFESFRRSWEITKLSFEVIKKDKELLLFPLFAGIFSILFIAAMVVPTIVTSLLKDANAAFTIADYIIVFLVYLGLAIIATFFNVCVVYTTKTRFEGGNATFMESVKFAFSKLHLILSWSILSATVGLILRIIDNAAERLGGIGKLIVNIITRVLGGLWSIITVFVVPGMVYHDLGPFGAIRKSVSALKKTWGESLIRVIGLGLVEFGFLILGVVLTVGSMILLSPLGVIAIGLVVLLAIIYFIGVILVFGVANSVFNTALFVYADSGKVPGAFNEDVLKNAFKSRKKTVI